MTATRRAPLIIFGVLVAVIVVGHVMYASVFAPHLVTKVSGLVTAGPDEQLFEGVPNQPE